MKLKKKYQRGTARVFIPRNRAMKKLQLNLKDFRRLCVLKGIYPREPSHIKKANKGSTENRIYYHLKDINFLANEPLLEKFREYKIFLRRISHARAKFDQHKVKTLLCSKPVFNLDHIVKERYPTFNSALRDLDDALCLCFAFSALTRSKIARPKVIDQCRRLTIEFMHYIIELNALRKVFVSIKGVYYQAEIFGERITWVVGHERAVGRANELDFSIMANFADFYITMLSFVNFRLYKSIGLYYPPQLRNAIDNENEYNFKSDSMDQNYQISSLAFSLKREFTAESESEGNIDSFFESDDVNSLADLIQQRQKMKTLFSNFRFFMNREVPKEALTFIIRSCDGVVSWDGLSPSLFEESSDLVTHQIVDRNIQISNINRVYVQPQWVFDCFNSQRILPSMQYAPSSILPPHLSPFVDQNVEDYINTEKVRLLKEDAKEVQGITGKKTKETEEKNLRNMNGNVTIEKSLPSVSKFQSHSRKTSKRR